MAELLDTTPVGVRRQRGRPGDRPSGKVAWSAAKCHPAVLALDPGPVAAPPAPASSSAPASAHQPLCFDKPNNIVSWASLQVSAEHLQWNMPLMVTDLLSRRSL